MLLRDVDRDVCSNEAHAPLFIGILPANLLYDIIKHKSGMTEIMPLFRKHYDTVLPDRPERFRFFIIP